MGKNSSRGRKANKGHFYRGLGTVPVEKCQDKTERPTTYVIRGIKRVKCPICHDQWVIVRGGKTRHKCPACKGKFLVARS